MKSRKRGSAAEIERQAKLLAADNMRANPTITAVYWFPDDEEVRLVEAENDMIPSHSRSVEPFYFPPAPQDRLQFPSAIAIVRTDEIGSLALPEGWGNWQEAVPLEKRK